MTRSTLFTHSLATFGYVGTLRPGPGTWGSLAALPVGWAIHVLGGPFVFLLAIIVVFYAGLWATERETAGQDDHDPSEIVIDEVAGQWVALLPVSFGAWMMGADVLRLWPGIVAAFLLFRLFDVYKLGPVGWADRMNTPMGVMLDDIIAGALAAVGVVILAAAAHGVLM